MNLFLDNDVLEKLASWNLLDPGVRACGFDMDAVRILPTEKYRLGLVGRTRPKHPASVLARIQPLVDQGQECAAWPPVEFDALTDVPHLDAGEVILYAHTALTRGALLATGDRRSIEAVASDPRCAVLADHLSGRVLCLEQVLLRTVVVLGFDEVKARVVQSNALAIDTAVRAAFGSGAQADAHNACSSLEERIAELATVARVLLAPHEFLFI